MGHQQNEGRLDWRLRPAPLLNRRCVGTIIATLLFASVEPARSQPTNCVYTDGCEPTLGVGYPASCPAINKVLVLDKGVVNAPDPCQDRNQRETAIAAAADGCDLTLMGSWLDAEHPFYEGGAAEHIAVTLSCDAGNHWYEPGGPTTPCPMPLSNGRGFLNDEFFIGDCPGQEPQCFDPEDCPEYTINAPTWDAADPAVAVGGSGTLFLVGADGAPPGHRGLLFTRTCDKGESFGGPGFPSDRPLKHICESEPSNVDRPGIAANPSTICPDPCNQPCEEVFVFWNEAIGHENIKLLRSLDGGNTFSGGGSGALVLDDNGDDQNVQVFAPDGAMSTEGDLYVAWTEITAALELNTRILMRHFDGSDWHPPLGSEIDPYQVAEPFNGFALGAPPIGLGSERSVPSVAVDRSFGPHHGWIYVAYAEYGDPPAFPSREKFTRSCNNGVRWSTPCVISPDTASPNAAQVYPRIGVDGRGNIGLSWYDTRFDASGPGEHVMYDLFFAYSSNGGEDWIEQRVTAPAEDELPQFQPVGLGATDYSAMAADPRIGESRFYILAMGTPRAEAVPEQDIYFYEIKLRVAGDWNGDYDLDLDDWMAFDSCFEGMNNLAMDECLVFDFDDDGHVSLADETLFLQDFTGPLCECADLCQLDPECLGSAPLGPGAPPMGAEGIPGSCEVVVPLLTVAPIDAVSQFADTLRAYIVDNPDAPDHDEVSHFAGCLETALR